MLNGVALHVCVADPSRKVKSNTFDRSFSVQRNKPQFIQRRFVVIFILIDIFYFILFYICYLFVRLF